MKFIRNLLQELTRRSNNSKLLRKLFGIDGRDSFTVFFWRKYKAITPDYNKE
jgi:hypothetical protein